MHETKNHKNNFTPSILQGYQNKLIFGFTFIELMIAIAIMVVLFTVGYANFREFNQRKILERGVLKVEADLRFTQELALAGRKPAGCDVLIGYNFLVSDDTTYVLQAVCGNDVYDVKTEDRIFDELGLTLSAPTPNPILFKVLGQGVDIDPASPAIITVSQTLTGNTHNVSIAAGGDISY